ncbi:MAG: glycine cleavage system protein GcvH [Polyangia bacterium]|jgi:glycine cleavage system H protein
MSDSYPDDLLYTEDHEWARREGNVVTVGISQFAVEQLGDVTQVDLPREGEMLKQHDAFGSVESVKAVSDIFAPIAGKVVKVNTTLHDSPEYVNEDPYDGGWMIQIEPANPEALPNDLKKLMDATAYEAFLKEHED